MKKFTILIILNLLLTNFLLAQNLSTSKQKLVAKKEQQIIDAQKNNNPIEFCRFNKEIAEIYLQAHLNSRAIPYYIAAIKSARTSNNSSLLRILNLDLVEIYSRQKKYGKAIPILEEANKIGEKLQLGKKTLYSEELSIASFYRLNGQAQKALLILKPLYNNILFQAYDDNLLNDCINELIETSKIVSDNITFAKFTKIKNIKNIKKKETEFNEKTLNLKNVVNKNQKTIEEKNLQLNENQKALLRTRDSLKNAEEAKKRSALQLQIQDGKLKLKNEELNREKLITRVLISGLFLALLVIGVITYLGLQLKKKNAELKLKNTEIFQQKEEIQTINDDLNEKNAQIKKQHKQLTSAIDYAHNIQIATLPIDRILNQYFQTFKVYLPKDIVSGDFYWYAEVSKPNTNNLIHFYAAVDCTGHGVPGAFMSMIGNRLLNEIIYQKNILAPKDILQTLNIELQLALNQSENDNDDGMDVALCRIEKLENGKSNVIFCGANRPLIYFSNKSKELIYKRGTLATIGGLEGQRFNEEFENIEIELQAKDMIYLTTDGIVDQNNPDRKKFGTKYLLQTLKAGAEYNLEIQKSQIIKVLKDFQQNSNQRDDITIFGIQI